ncbi:MAG: OmpA family protein [Roseinatronobacter sp.]|nr:OmpA family protein [Roseinatronobacter sp.]
MTFQRRFFLLGALGFSLTACDSSSSFYKEAGIGLDEGGFGNPTMHNSMLQSGEISLAEVMTRRFHAEVPSMVNFAFDSAEISQEARGILQMQARWMRQFPELRYTIYGHTDLVGSTAYNRRLGQRRADAVATVLVSFGVPRRSIIAVVSRGQTQPLIATQGYEPANRRTVTEVSGLVRRATAMQGQYAQIIQREFITSAQEPHRQR